MIFFFYSKLVRLRVVYNYTYFFLVFKKQKYILSFFYTRTHPRTGSTLENDHYHISPLSVFNFVLRVSRAGEIIGDK